MLFGFFEMVLYFTNTGVRKVVVARNAILYSWSLVDVQTLQRRCYTIRFGNVLAGSTAMTWLPLAKATQLQLINVVWKKNQRVT